MTVGARDAVLPVDKPTGPTSHDVVAVARRALRERRIGHTGTLDPFASGLLLLCVGRATRIAQFLSGMDKTYEATARLGIATDTEDRDGDIIAESDGWRAIGLEQIERACDGVRGILDQVPPRFSAKKVDGERAHRKARRGEPVALESVTVVVHDLEVLGYEPPDVTFRVRCSSGTYVRSLARDIGEALGVGAHLTELRRTRIGVHGVECALSLDDLAEPERVRDGWIDPLTALAHLPRLDLDAEQSAALGHGRAISAAGRSDEDVTVAAHGDRLVAIGAVRDEHFHPRKVFSA